MPCLSEHILIKEILNVRGINIPKYGSRHKVGTAESFDTAVLYVVLTGLSVAEGQRYATDNLTE